VADLIRRRIIVAGAAVALVLGVRATAHAHAMLLSAEPAAGSHLASSPARVRLLFSEQLETALAKLSLTGGDGRVIELVVSADPHDVRALIAPVSGLTPGSYRLDWHIVSADGHPVDGSYLFSVGNAGGAPPPADSFRASATRGAAFAGAPLVPAILRGLAGGALMALAGMLFFLSRSLSGERPAALVRWLTALVVVLLAANLVAWAANAVPGHDLTADAFASALSTGAGRVLVVQGALALLAAWALWLARREKLALLFATAAVIAGGASGHPAAIHPLLSIPSKSVHLLASAAWIGGLLWLGTTDRTDAAAFAREAAKVSGAALVAVVLVALSGIAQTLLFLPSLLDLFRSAYGLVIVAKIAGLLVLVAFGAHHRYRVMPRLDAAPAAAAQLASSVRRELAVMAIVVLLGGLLAYIPPPSSSMSAMPDMPPTSTH
jgi:copper transport protein